MNTNRILMLEDNPLDVKIIQNLISRSGFPAKCTVVATGKDYIDKLSTENFDLILSDHQLPDFDSIRALQVRNEGHSHVPFILITGAVSEDMAIAILKQGADDYVLKDRLQRLPVAIEEAIQKKKSEMERKSIETSLSVLTERFQLAAKTSFDVIWDYDFEKDLIYCSDAIEKITGAPCAESFHPAQLKTFVHPDDLPSFEKSLMHTVLGREHRWRKIFRVVRADGNISWINSNALILRDKKEKAKRIVGVMHDVTEIRRLQHELMEQEKQKQKEMAEAALHAQEKERTEIGKELHDNVNQLLATAKIMIDTARSTPELHDICLTKSQESIMDAIHELRNLAHSMLPPMFDNFDFAHIINDLVSNIRLSGKMNVDIDLPEVEELKLIPNNIKLALYRIIQEQLSNIFKHSNACNVIISLHILAENFELEIKDDGVGFDPEKKNKGIGLRNMESRAVVFGGSMRVESEPGRGCQLVVRIPVKHPVLDKLS